ncbi:IclR family transcriptional regulator [Lachnospiraceae bacterium NSJ-143]|nr:IclR family transcriptional regulator [Lachnospiraceae bacterium NSJ-143]
MGKTKNIQSLERAFSILELFEENNRKMSVKEISLALGLSKSTVFGLINTLSNLGYLMQDSETLKYNLGFKVLALGNAVSRNDMLSKVADKCLQPVSDKFQETSLCVIEENGYVVYIAKAESSSSIVLKTRIGTKKELYCTGVGKCYLAFMPQEKSEEILSRGLETKTENTITSIEKMRVELDFIRKNGYAVDNEEYETGISCVAVPVFGRGREIISAISLTGPVFRIKELDLDIVVDSLKEAADNIRKKLMV